MPENILITFSLSMACLSKFGAQTEEMNHKHGYKSEPLASFTATFITYNQCPARNRILGPVAS